MADKHKIEVFSAHEAIEAVRREAGSASEIVVHDMKDINVVRRAKAHTASMRAKRRRGQ